MIGERIRRNPTVDIPPWTYTDDQTANMHFMLSPSANSNSTSNFSNLAEDYSPLFLQHHANDVDEFELENRDIELPVDVYACDNFRMYEFKVRSCARGSSHDWTECPFVHPGEKARRRDPRKYHYSGTACPDFRKGNCSRGDGCDLAHGVFECWLHPGRYRTQPCKDGVNCKRRVCFFAHSPEQLRVLGRSSSDPFDNSPRRYVKTLHFVSSPESSSPPTESPPMSPMTTNSYNSLSRSLGSNLVNDVIASFRQLQLNRLNSMPSLWNVQMGSPVHWSPRQPVTPPSFCSLPATPTADSSRSRNRCFDPGEKGDCEEEPVMERVESGRDLRVKMFERLCKENPLDHVNPNQYSVSSYPNVVKVRDLIQ